MPETRGIRTPNRVQIRATGQGILAESFERQGSRTTGALADGVIYFQSVGLAAGDIVTNISTQITSAGASVTLSKLGIYDKTFTRLGLTADQGTGWQTGGGKTVALTSPVTITVDDIYYLAIIAKASVTLPSVMVGSGATPVSLSGAKAPCALLTAQTDLGAGPLSPTETNSLNVWLACS